MSLARLFFFALLVPFVLFFAVLIGFVGFLLRLDEVEEDYWRDVGRIHGWCLE